MSPVNNIILNGPTEKKKKGKVFFVIFFLLIVILIALCGAYWYFINYMQETPKMAFFKYVGQNNFDNILNTDIYYTMLDKIESQNYKTETTANFTTTKENDFSEEFDISKLELILNTTSDKKNQSNIWDAKLNYSSNDIFNLKLISTKDSVGIGSNEILDKYIATSKEEYSNSINRVTGYETDISLDTLDESIDTISNNKINLEEEYKKQKITEYSDLVFNLIPEESFTENENVIVTIDSKTINTGAYTLSLDSNKYKEVLSTVLNNLKKDKELLSKIVTGEETENIEEQEVQEEKQNTINPLPNVQVDYTGAETEEHQMMLVSEEDNNEQLEVVQDFPDENLVGEENTVEDSISEVSPYDDEEFLEDEEFVNNETELFQNLIFSFMLNQKIDGTVDELIEDIEKELENIENIKEGLKVTVYVKNVEEQPKETVKVVMELPDEASLDIEYQTENKTKLTYLEEIEDDEKTNTVGIAIEIERNATDVKNTFNIQISAIEDKKVVSKTQLKLDTEGSKSSKDYTNEILIKYNDSESDFKININNKINFKNIQVEETLNDENAIFVDKLSDEELNILYTQILEKIVQVYSEKLVSLNFIDNNSISSVIEQPTIEETVPEEQVTEEYEGEQKDLIRQKLIETVSNLLGQAQENGLTFTVHDLAYLTIEGYDVTSEVVDEVATIVINGYTFKIDQNFILTEE